MSIDFSFGDFVTFDVEYRSCGNRTVNVQQAYGNVIDEAYDLGVDLFKDIRVKNIYPLKKSKLGIFIGTIEINTLVSYEYYCHCTDVGTNEGFKARKGGLVEVAEIRCEGIKKTYYAPLDNLKRISKQ